MPAVHSAGGVLWRPTAEGIEVCLVHRPRYDDWSLPKGKLHAGEHPLAGAVREVREETGTGGVPQLRLPTVHYTLPGDVAKRVDFWSMRADGGPAGPRDDEADAIAWVSPSVALNRVSYAEDARVLRDFIARPPVTVTVALVRHAHAGKRGTYPGPDRERPLDPDGRKEAQALAPLLGLAAPRRLVSATARRCVETLECLAEDLQLPVDVDPTFDEPAEPNETAHRAAVAASRLIELAGAGTALVVCSQGKLMPHLLALLAGDGSADHYRTPKGTGWLLAFNGAALVGMDRVVPADAERHYGVPDPA